MYLVLFGIGSCNSTPFVAKATVCKGNLVGLGIHSYMDQHSHKHQCCILAFFPPTGSLPKGSKLKFGTDPHNTNIYILLEIFSMYYQFACCHNIKSHKMYTHKDMPNMKYHG
jgi:hypothetical protein